MAFPAQRSAAALRPGNELLIYTTRGCFGNPTRDRGRVIGRAAVITTVELVRPMIEIEGRRFSAACDIAVSALAPIGQGVELGPLVEELDVFPDPRSWSVWLRRPILELPDRDAELLTSFLEPITELPAAVLGGYGVVG